MTQPGPDRDPPTRPDSRAADRAARRLSWRMESIASGGVALLALFISAYTVYISRLQLKAQVWPRLALVGEEHPAEGTTNADPGVTLSLKNRGVAPGEVRAMRITVGDQVVTNWIDWLKLLMKRQNVKITGRLMSADSPVGEVVAAGESYKMLDTDSADIALLLGGDDESVFSICYCSTLEDCWLLEAPIAGSASKTTPVARCPSDEKFEGVPKGLMKEEVKRKRAAKDAGGAPVDAGTSATDAATNGER